MLVGDQDSDRPAGFQAHCQRRGACEDMAVRMASELSQDGGTEALLEPVDQPKRWQPATPALQLPCYRIGRDFGEQGLAVAGRRDIPGNVLPRVSAFTAYRPSEPPNQLALFDDGNSRTLQPGAQQAMPSRPHQRSCSCRAATQDHGVIDPHAVEHSLTCSRSREAARSFQNASSI